MNSTEKRKMVMERLRECEKDGRFGLSKAFLQHGTCSVYKHSVSVAIASLEIARRFKLKVDYDSLVRGALLHDYFLYDWHDLKGFPCAHGFLHPYRALKNAQEDFELNACEKDIIAHHMFPLVPFPPATKEGWIVCLADKICAAQETVALRGRKLIL